MQVIVDPREKVVADIGCGGGIYSRAWSHLGASQVIGIDFSARMVDDARNASTGYPTLSFQQGEAATTGLPVGASDIVFERALIHHLPDLDAAFSEAARILEPGGTLIVQDRTMENVQALPSPQHLRGYFFERFPRLLDLERERRPDTAAVANAMRRAGFLDVVTTTLPEIRRIYDSPRELETDLRARTGRSILHALDDHELEQLIDTILERTHDTFPLEETDFWTVWAARVSS